jgi:hypothetical protein
VNVGRVGRVGCSAGERAEGPLGSPARSGLVVSYWNATKSVRLSVTDFAFNGWFDRLALPEFKTL